MESKRKKTSSSSSDVDVVALQENMMFADDLTETLLVQMIHTMGENLINISDKEFVRDIGFVIEAVKSTVYRHAFGENP